MFKKQQAAQLVSSPVASDNSQGILDKGTGASTTPAPAPKKLLRLVLPGVGSIPMGDGGSQPPGYPISTGLFAIGAEAYFSDGKAVCHLSPEALLAATGMSDTSTLRSVSEIPSMMENDGECPVPKGTFKLNAALYKSDGSTSYCRYLNDAHFLSATGATSVPNNLMSVDAIPAGMSDGGVCGLAAGAFQVAYGLYYSNGNDAYCSFENSDHMKWKLGQNVSVFQASDLPNMRDDGKCRYGEGVFAVGNAAFYSNGVNAFCGFNSPAHLQTVANISFAQITHTMSAVPANMQNDGTCRYAAGLFMVGAGVYYSNGKDAFCGFNSPAHLLWVTGKNSTAGIPVLPNLPSNSMKNDGECRYGVGGFVANGGGYYSNGTSYCVFNSPAHYLWSIGQDVSTARVLPNVPANQKNDGECAYQPGLFNVNGGIYSSNGTAFCGFNSMGHLQLDTGLTSVASIRVLPKLPDVNKNDGTCGYSAGLFNLNGGIYYTSGTAFCGFNSMAHFTWNTGKTSTAGIPAVPALPAGQRNDGECGYPAGLFMVGQGVFYSNGTTQYCSYSSFDLYQVLTGRNEVNGIPSLPKVSDHLANGGVCQGGKYAAGIFAIGQAVFYSNGSTAYCAFNSMDHYRWSTGRTELNGVPHVSSLPSAMQNNGQCGYGAGFFMVNGGVYYSNGSAFCGYNSMGHYTWATGRTETNGIPNVPNFGNLANQGTCAYPAGLYNVNGSIFYSNGQNGFCGYNSMAHLTMATGRTNVNGIPVLPNVQPGSANGGVCKLGAGLYMVGGGVYYSNGNSYCVFNSVAHYSWNTGRNEMNGIPSLPGQSNQMGNDGECKYPAGLFNVNGGIFYSNGVNAFCGYSSWERFVAGTGLNTINGIRQLPKTPSAMQNNGSCN